MRPVAIIGIGKTAFGAFPDRDLRSLAVEAGQKCLADAHVSPSQVEAFYLGNFAGPSFVGQNHLAPYIAGAMGITGAPCTRFEAACASSGSACSAGSLEPSHVVAALGLERQLASSLVRFSLGRESNQEEVERVVSILPDVIKRAQTTQQHWK